MLRSPNPFSGEVAEEEEEALSGTKSMVNARQIFKPAVAAAWQLICSMTRTMKMTTPRMKETFC